MMGESRLRPFAAYPAADKIPQTVVEQTFIDPAGVEDWWVRWYLEGFVDQGHGKVKLLVGRPGSGKTHFLRHFAHRAEALGYRVAMLDAARDRILAIDDVYRLVAGQMPWDHLIITALKMVIADELGYPEFTGPPEEFLLWGESTRNLSPHLLRRDVREAIDAFLRQIDLEGEFLLAVREWMNQVVAMQPADPAVIDWLRGIKIGAARRKNVGLRNEVSKRNARALMASVAGFIHRVSGRGLLVFIDNVGVLALTTRVDGRPYYTRSGRDQSYEMLRQLIDESAFSPYLMTILAGDVEQVSNPRTGFPSYPALWARLQTEVNSTRPNLFADLVDLDRLWEVDRERLDRLALQWQTLPLSEEHDWTSATSQETLGLEWGWPRRLVADILNQRLYGEEGVQ